MGLVEPPALGHAGHPFGTEGGLRIFLYLIQHRKNKHGSHELLLFV